MNAKIASSPQSYFKDGGDFLWRFGRSCRVDRLLVGDSLCKNKFTIWT